MVSFPVPSSTEIECDTTKKQSKVTFVPKVKLIENFK